MWYVDALLVDEGSALIEIHAPILNSMVGRPQILNLFDFAKIWYRV